MIPLWKLKLASIVICVSRGIFILPSITYRLTWESDTLAQYFPEATTIVIANDKKNTTFTSWEIFLHELAHHIIFLKHKNLSHDKIFLDCCHEIGGKISRSQLVREKVDTNRYGVCCEAIIEDCT